MNHEICPAGSQCPEPMQRYCIKMIKQKGRVACDPREREQAEDLVLKETWETGTGVKKE